MRVLGLIDFFNVVDDRIIEMIDVREGIEMFVRLNEKPSEIHIRVLRRLAKRLAGLMGMSAIILEEPSPSGKRPIGLTEFDFN